MKQPPRVAWREFPDAVLLAAERRTRRHPAYRTAKSGDAVAGNGLEWNVTTVSCRATSCPHTGADGFGRLARQAAFTGAVAAGREYVMIDDFIGQGGTLANLRGWIETCGGTVIGAVSLTGKTYSAIVRPSRERLHELEQKHGQALERWWRQRFGHAFDCLTESEARYLARSPDVDTIRNRIAAAKQAGNGPGSE